jgi:hypothetical protein
MEGSNTVGMEERGKQGSMGGARERAPPVRTAGVGASVAAGTGVRTWGPSEH